jgi:hypothetical protein
MTGDQSQAVARLLQILFKGTAAEFHHGGALGADHEASSLAGAIGYTIVVHPGGTPKENIARNHDIVDVARVMIAAPFGGKELLRSGTWATIRYCKGELKHKPTGGSRPLYIVWPDGSYDQSGFSPGRGSDHRASPFLFLFQVERSHHEWYPGGLVVRRRTQGNLHFSRPAGAGGDGAPYRWKLLRARRRRKGSRILIEGGVRAARPDVREGGGVMDDKEKEITLVEAVSGEETKATREQMMDLLGIGDPNDPTLTDFFGFDPSD